MTTATLLAQAQAHASTGQHDALLATCQRILDDTHSQDVNALLDVAALLLGSGHVSPAQACLQQAIRLAPQDYRAHVNLANLYREIGEHRASRQLYQQLVHVLPDHPLIRRNALVSLEYDPDASPAVRRTMAQLWGEWAQARVGGRQPRPPAPALNGRPLRVGYVSADFCQHTVGLLVQDVLRAHNPARVSVFAYSAGGVSDWVSRNIAACSQWRDVAALDDAALAAQVRADGIDVLVDLSGHTAGSRLTAFALRPAPVQASWLGYFATTGLSDIDALLLDDWHAPPEVAAQCIEPVWRLPRGKFCYQPAPWAPATVAPPPCLSQGHITFGYFNNTSKLNPAVLALWARLLHAIPHARLLLKWRTLIDAGLRQRVANTFAEHGIDPARISCRGASFHADLLHEYADIDIALDPFPFTGGLTSCEALWMGVPVLTWPGATPVSRQTWALLAAIGLPELAARDEHDYLRIAQQLASQPEHLNTLRHSLRARMQASPLMDPAGFARQLEDAWLALYGRVAG